MLVDKLPNKKSVQIIVGQLLRSATRIGANIIKAQAASSRKDFINFLTRAPKNTDKIKFWLLILKESVSNYAAEINLIEVK